ncbi:hypothetical protein GCM10011374_38000 [Kocuria dechangensis]|uniref:Uncharacterized protein n=1 Tax=Kocuria dechangensis TaxID=1176249 RepID=A0A917H7U5_9MICC|nr:hypothetical protein GCM10011374_38000 [Kocuria dechangensis]
MAENGSAQSPTGTGAANLEAVAYGMPVARTTSPSRRPCTGPQGGVNVGVVVVMLSIYQKPEQERRVADSASAIR